jgi:hypothetical protein
VCKQRVHSRWRILRVNQRRLDEKSTLLILVSFIVYRSHIIISSSLLAQSFGSEDNTLSVFDVNTLQLIHHLKGHTGPVVCVCFSNEDKLIASGSADTTILVRSVSTGEVTHRLKGHTHSVYCVCFSNDDKLIASGSWDTTIIVWSVSTGEVTHRFTGHTHGVCYVCFSNDDYYSWSEAFGLKTRLFEMISRKCVSEEKPLWAVKNDEQKGKSADGRIEYSLDTAWGRNSGHKIIIEVVERAQKVWRVKPLQRFVLIGVFFQKIVRSFLSFVSPTQ